LGGDIGLKKFERPKEIDPVFDIWIVDIEFSPILVILRKIMPNNLNTHMNNIMTEIWEKYHDLHKKKKHENRYV